MFTYAFVFFAIFMIIKQMTNNEFKEILIWGGGFFLAVVVFLNITQFLFATNFTNPILALINLF